LTKTISLVTIKQRRTTKKSEAVMPGEVQIIVDAPQPDGYEQFEPYDESCCMRKDERWMVVAYPIAAAVCVYVAMFAMKHAFGAL
jgi:hypothetical protein